MSPGADPLAATAMLRRHLGRVLAPTSGALCTAIHPADEMLTYPMQVLGRSAHDAVLEYFQVGHATFSLLTQVLEWLSTSWPRLGNLLDFAAGYGRVARFLATSGCAQVTVSDILPGAVEFQAEVLGVRGLPSNASPDRADLRGPYEFISVISLFSHLPEATFAGWLRRLTGALAPGGTMVFTTHGELAFAREAGTGLRSNGLVFHAASESAQLDRSSYGTTFVHPDHVRRLIAGLPHASLLAMVPHGLNEHQDVYVVGRDRPAPDVPLRLSPPPKVHVDEAERRADGTLHAAGWALDGWGREPVASVRLFAAERSLGPARLGGSRPDLARVFGSARAGEGGWSSGSHEPVAPADWLTALAVDAGGRRGFACRALSRPAATPHAERGAR
ncbi:MAG TPA: methyltransferase domain-containing protein [Planctomycetota bacterium]|nr:methyltransferase domain-containing protein [Planctomycetota bacterium]